MANLWDKKNKKGATVYTNFNVPVTVTGFIGEGGQGAVYRVKYNGEEKALKWLWIMKNKDRVKNPTAFRRNLAMNIVKGAPSPEFLWPLAITRKMKSGEFGYIMDLAPAGYEELEKFMQPSLTGVYFDSYKAVIEAAMKIVSAFRILHNNGYSYQDVNAGNFFINPKNGDVRVADNDNVAPNGSNLGVLGTPRYMAPEIVLGKGMPNTNSDRYSLAVILFMLIFKAHPLEGQHCREMMPSEENDRKLYGSEALFIMDPDNKSNAPIRSLHQKLVQLWNEAPDYLKEIFVRAFCQESLKQPAKRPTEMEWLKVLTRMRSEIVRCSCGNEIFIKKSSIAHCNHCGKTVPIQYQLVLPNCTIAVVKGARIYRSQLTTCNYEKALDLMGGIIQENGVFKLKNVTDSAWSMILSDGSIERILPKSATVLVPGATIKIDDGKIQIKQI